MAIAYRAHVRIVYSPPFMYPIVLHDNLKENNLLKGYELKRSNEMKDKIFEVIIILCGVAFIFAFSGVGTVYWLGFFRNI